MLRHTIVLAAVFCAQAQDEKASVEEELARLIEKTNALETLHLVYDVQSEEHGEETFELIYRAPDLARMRVTSLEGHGENWLAEGQVFLRTDEGAWRRAIVPVPPEASLLLHERFPGPELPLGPGVFLDMNLQEDPATQKTRFQISFKSSHTGREVLLGWLSNLQRRSSEVVMDGEWLESRDESHLLRVARKNGILDHVQTDTGRFQLRECHLDEPLDSKLVTLPAEARTAQIDPELTKALEPLFGPPLRRYAFLRVEGLLASEACSWNERTRADWRAFLAAFHCGQITRNYSAWLKKLHEQVDAMVKRVHERRALDDTDEGRARIEKDIAQSRDGLEASLDGSRSKYLDSLAHVESKNHDSREELYEIESQVIGEVWDEILSSPILADFDEKLAAAMER